MTLWPAPCPTCTGSFLSSHFAIRSHEHPDNLFSTRRLSIYLHHWLLFSAFPFFQSLGSSEDFEVMKVLQCLNCPIVSFELPRRFSASRGAQEASVTAFQIKLFSPWQISQGSQTTCLPSEQDLIWISALKLCDFIQIYDAKPFREEQRGKVFHLRVWEGETVILMHILTRKGRTGAVTSRNPQNLELDLLIFLSAWLRYCLQLLFHLYSQNWNGFLLLCWEWHLLLMLCPTQSSL